MAGTAKRTDIDMEEFRKRLLAERDQLRGLHREQRADMRAEAEDAAENELAGYSTFDSAESEDTAAMSADEDRDAAQDENVVETLHEIDRALNRIDAGTYGLDEITGEPIPVARLRAVPWATMTVENAAAREL